jgi:hypothetical protein
VIPYTCGEAFGDGSPARDPGFETTADDEAVLIDLAGRMRAALLLLPGS